MKNSRRDFLKLSAVGLAGRAVKAFPASLNMFNPPALKPIQVWVTNSSSKFASSPALGWRPAAQEAVEQYFITLNPNMKFQTMLGFGAAFTDASCYNFSLLPQAARNQLLETLFSPSQMGFNVCRTCIGSSDYSRSAYSFDEGDPDPQLKRFSIDHDKQYIIPVLQDVRKMNPDMFLFSSPWSPPGWMKDKNSLLGGVMQATQIPGTNATYLDSYANYFVRFLQAYRDAGVPINAVTPQNEVDTDQNGRMPQCAWPQETEMSFVGHSLGPLLAKNNLDTKIWILDHNYNLWGRVLDELGDPSVLQYANAVAWHGYAGTPDMMDKVQQQYPNVGMHWTEGGPGLGPTYATDWANWSLTFTNVVRHWCSSITAWNFILDEMGKPNIGPFDCAGLVQMDSQTKAISYSGQYYAFEHFCKTVRRGAQRFDSQSGGTEIGHVAFQNTDGGSVLILTNPGNVKKVVVRMGATAVDVSLSANSITTLKWQ